MTIYFKCLKIINMVEHVINILPGDCLEVMKDMEDNSIDSIITDPPYGILFMNRKWDYEIPAVEVFKQMLRVAKPGAFLLCFGGSRTFHRMAVNIEDAGFEIRDTIIWLYGSGFPKSYNISKGIEGKLTIGSANVKDIKKLKGTKERVSCGFNKTGKDTGYRNKEYEMTKTNVELTTPQAETWDGYGTALKPAFEPIIIAMKPIDRNYVNNALTHGVAGFNIDGCRIKTEEIKETYDYKAQKPSKLLANKSEYKRHNGNGTGNILGRFPANIILDEQAGKMLDEQSGILKSGGGNKNPETSNIYGGNSLLKSKTKGNNQNYKPDTGGASRFFYCAKASKTERNAGCEGLEEKECGKNQSSFDGGKIKTGSGNDRNNLKQNNHPTVKPLKLMEYLCNLTRTPTGGIVLDPFMGSGTTGIACKNTDRGFIGIEKNPEYIEIAKRRISNADKEPKLF